MPVLAVKTSLYTIVIRITGVFPRQHFSSWGRNYLSVTLCLSIDIIFLLPSGCKGRELSLFALLLQDRFARKTPQIGAATQTTINNPYRGLLVWLDSASWCYMASDQKSYMSPGVTQRSGFSFLTLCWMCVCPFLQENVLITLEIEAQCKHITGGKRANPFWALTVSVTSTGTGQDILDSFSQFVIAWVDFSQCYKWPMTVLCVFKTVCVFVCEGV